MFHNLSSGSEGQAAYYLSRKYTFLTPACGALGRHHCGHDESTTDVNLLDNSEFGHTTWSHWFAVGFGILNNILITLVFSQDRYKGRMFPMMLKYFCVTNLVASITLFFLLLRGKLPDEAFRLLLFLHLIALRINGGLLVLANIFRVIYCLWPLLAVSQNAVYIVTLSCMVLFSVVLLTTIKLLVLPLSIHWIDIILDDGSHQVIIFLACILTTLFLILWNVLEVARWKRRHSSLMLKTISEKVTDYLRILSCLYVLTTFPSGLMFTIHVEPHSTDLTCQSCYQLMAYALYLTYFMYMNVLLNNLILCFVSQGYREDLSKSFKMIIMKFFNSKYDQYIDRVKSLTSTRSSNVRK